MLELSLVWSIEQSVVWPYGYDCGYSHGDAGVIRFLYRQLPPKTFDLSLKLPLNTFFFQFHPAGSIVQWI